MTQSKSDNWVRIFHVDDPKRHRNGFTIYKVTSVVFPKNAPEAATNIVVWKRYNDFRALHNSLKIHHKNYNITEELPKLSKAKYFKRFEDEIIRDRIKCILDLLNFIGGHPPLFTCAPFIQFFNSSYQLSDAISDYQISTVTHDNGNVRDSSGDLLNIGIEEKDYLIGGMKKDIKSLEHNRNSIDVDNSSLHSISSEDDNCRTTSEGTVCFKESVSSNKSKLPLDNMIYQGNGTNSTEEADTKLKNNNNQITISCTVRDKDFIMEGDRFSYVDNCLTAGEMVSCHTEKPIKDSEMWVYVNARDLPSTLSDEYDGDDDEPSINGAIYATENYLVEAAYHVGHAQKCEVAGEYEASFSFYKGALKCLMNGVSEELSAERKSAVQEKIKRYAEKAENMYRLLLSKKEENEKIISCTKGLKTYKVLSVIDKVLLVMDTTDSKRYVMKVLQKSPCPIDVKKKTIIPYNVPYMVKLIKYFENDNSIFLVLQYARGGKLYDHVNHCFRSCTDLAANSNTEYERSAEGKETVGGETRKNTASLFNYYAENAAQKIFTFNTQENGGLLSNGKDSTNVNSKSETICERPVQEIVVDGHGDNGDVEVSYLVENSQRLLESIRNTLENSEHETVSLTQDIMNIESVIVSDQEITLGSTGEHQGCLVDYKERRRSKSVARSRFERRYSSEDIREQKSRTASNSLDRSGQWARLTAMLESEPKLSESKIREWAAELLVALETLHRWGITCRDLHPDNLLLDEKGHVLLTFQIHWRGVDSSVSEEAVTGLYAAPETNSIYPVTYATDWWSFGALLFELFTGKSLSSCYPGGIVGHTVLTFPEFMSPEACSLLSELLRYEPSERLGGGVNGSDDIKCHPFFSSIDWQLVYDVT